MAGSTTVTVSGEMLTLDGSLSDGGAGYSLTKTGPGGLVLTGNNTYTGNTTANAGLLVLTGASSYANTIINSAGTLQSATGRRSGTLGSGSITDNGMLSFARGDNTLNVATAIAGSGSVYVTGGGGVTLSASNTYAGSTTVNSGTLQIGAGGSTGTLGGGPVVVRGSLLFDASDSGLSVANSISGSGGRLPARNRTRYAVRLQYLFGRHKRLLRLAGGRECVFAAGLHGPGAGSVANGSALILGYGGTGQFQWADIATVLANFMFNGSPILGLDTTNAAAPVSLTTSITAPAGLTLIKTAAAR